MTYDDLKKAFIANFKAENSGPPNNSSGLLRLLQFAQQAWLMHISNVVNNGGEFPTDIETTTLRVAEGKYCLVINHHGVMVAQRMEYTVQGLRATFAAAEAIMPAVKVNYMGIKIITTAEEAFQRGLRAA